MTKRYGLVIDLERCIGCHTCTMACKMEHGIEVGSGIRVETVGGPHRDTPAGTFPDFSMYYLPIACMHCADPPCREACAAGAIVQREDGIVFVDESQCNGCRECLAVCPYAALIFDEERQIARKCDLCRKRLDEGFEPFCIVCCPEEAIRIGDLNDRSGALVRAIQERDGYTIKPERNTGAAVYYLPPLPRRTR